MIDQKWPYTESVSCNLARIRRHQQRPAPITPAYEGQADSEIEFSVGRSRSQAGAPVGRRFMPGAAGPEPESRAPTAVIRGNPDVKVWVNTNSAAYHCRGTRWFGKTREGEYMTQKEALGKGYHPAQHDPCL